MSAVFSAVLLLDLIADFDKKSFRAQLWFMKFIEIHNDCRRKDIDWTIKNHKSKASKLLFDENQLTIKSSCVNSHFSPTTSFLRKGSPFAIFGRQDVKIF